MNFVALKMLVGDRGKYFGIVMGLTFASLLITQQAAIFFGMMDRTYGSINDVGLPDIWVMDSRVQFIDDIKPLQDSVLYRIRGVEGVQWAVPHYRGLLEARLDNGTFQACNILGLDDTTLVGGPPEMVRGKLEDLRRADSVIVDADGAAAKLAHVNARGESVPLKVGDTLELNDHRATVVGFCKVSKTLQSEPVVYTTYSRATLFAPRERKLLSFVLAKAKPGVDPEEVCRRIVRETADADGRPRLAAYTRSGFIDKTWWYFFSDTAIPINFAISVALGFVVGTAIVGQTFYSFTLENLKQFAALKAMGTANGTLLRMIMLQALVVGLIGYGLGMGLACLAGWAARNSELAFVLPGGLMVGSFVAILAICFLSSLLSIWKVMKLEPAIVFKG